MKEIKRAIEVIWLKRSAALTAAAAALAAAGVILSALALIIKKIRKSA